MADGKGRFAAREQYDKSAQNDPEYMKVVREIQEGHTRAGWLAGSGAFDRDDLAYIRDFKEIERQKEQDLLHAEASEFAKLKSSLEEGEAKALAASKAAQSRKDSRQSSKSMPIRVISSKSRRSGSLEEPEPGPSHKRQQVEPHKKQQQPEAMQKEKSEAASVLGLLGDYDSSSSEGLATGEREERAEAL